MKIYVIRHCQATGQSADAPLTDTGFEQAKKLSGFLKDKGIRHVVSSPYLRATQSVEPFVQTYQVPMRVDDRLAERVLSHPPIDNWLDCLRQSFEDFHCSFIGGESSQEAMQRIVNAANDAISLGAGCFALVTHGNIMTLLLKHFDDRFGFDDWAALTNPDVFLVDVDANGATVSRVWTESSH